MINRAAVKNLNRSIFFGYALFGSIYLLSMVFKIQINIFPLAFFLYVAPHIFFVVSMLIGTIKTTLTLFKYDDEYWKSFVPINFGMSLMAISYVFMFYDRYIDLVYISIIGMVSALLIVTQKWILHGKILPASLLGMIVVSSLPKFNLFWMQIIFYSGVLFFLIPICNNLKLKFQKKSGAI